MLLDVFDTKTNIKFQNTSTNRINSFQVKNIIPIFANQIDLQANSHI